MADIQIKRYVQGTGWIDLHPRTLVRNVMGGTNNNIPLVGDGGKINTTFLPDYLLGQLIYGGVINGSNESMLSSVSATLSTNGKSKLDVSSNAISLTTADSGYNALACEGMYFIFSGYSSSNGYTVLGLEDVRSGDWIIATGSGASGWKKIDNTDAVTSVNGNVGAVAINSSNLPGLSDALATKLNTSAIADWAKAATKPSYNFSEIGNKPTTLSGYGITDAATSTHTHTTSIAASSGNSQLDLTYGGKFAITAGGTSFIFKMPSAKADTWRPINVNGTEKINDATTPLNFIAQGAASVSFDAQTNSVVIGATNTTYSDATTSTHGLMTAANLITLNTLRATTNPASSTDGDICFVTV